MAQAHLFPDVRAILKAIALSVMALCLFAVSANAQDNGWEVCNQTSTIIETATGRPSGSDVIIEGWNRIRPGECRSVLAAPLRPGPHFLYGRTSRAHRGGMQEWTGEYDYCVDAQGSFSVESPPDCTVMGLETRGFQPVLIESRSNWKTTLTETQKWTMRTARAAGIQRLLSDAGIEKPRIDGFIGRRTRGAIATFLKSRDIATDSSDSQVMDYLERVAIDRARNLGLTLCNRTEERVWTAIGQRRGQGWESRGWWPLEAGGCERVIDEALLSTPHYVFAEIETPAGPRRLTGASESFCMTRSQFAILDRTECAPRFYDEGFFLETAVPEEGRLVFELFARNFELDISEAGLRR